MFSKSRFFCSLLLAAPFAFSVPAGAAGPKEVEVVHWWTSGGEAAGLAALRKTLEAQGFVWKDAPIAGGGGSQAMTVLQARITAGNPPTAAQMIGFDIQDWAEQGVLADLNPLAQQQGWDKVIPSALQRFAKHKGVWVAAPLNVHSTNWVWGNRAALEKIGVSVLPTTWDEFIAALDKAKAAGMIPLAHGGQPWQEATLFDSVVMTTGGPDFYKKALIDLDPGTLGSPVMKNAFERLAKLKTYVDPNFSGRDWNLASAMVIKGEAAFQVMGDWAKGEFLAAHKTPGKDFVCFRFPGTQGTVTFLSDQFAMFKVGSEQQAAQKALATVIETPEFQSTFNLIKGSVPARSDVSDAAFDACGKKAIADLAEASRNGGLLGSMALGHAAPAAIKGAVYDIVTRAFNNQLSPEQAWAALPKAIAAAK